MFVRTQDLWQPSIRNYPAPLYAVGFLALINPGTQCMPLSAGIAQEAAADGLLSSRGCHKSCAHDNRIRSAVAS